MPPSRKRATTRRSGRKPPRRSSLGGILLLLALVALAGVGGALIWLWPRCQGAECPSVETLRTHTPAQASRVLAADGEVLAHLAPERRIVIPLERIPAELAGAFLAVEDRRFFRHGGVDYRRAVGALVADLRTLRFDEGFSTITMQLARNVFPEHLTREKTLRRKLWEIMLAREIEDSFSKDEILEMYLNQIYLGNGLYGVEAAAQGYFGKPAARLDVREAALLAALPKAPSTYDPRRNPAAAIRRRNLVLSLMADAGVVEAEQAERAKASSLGLVPPLEAKGEAPYLVAAVRRELRQRFGPGAESAGLRVHTGLDRGLQAAAIEALREQLAMVERGEIGPYRGPRCDGDSVDQPERCLQGLFVAMDARTGDVLALVGGRDFALSQFDRVTQARRQAGSAFKPFVYATALTAGIPITTPLVGPSAADLEGGYRPADHVADSANLDLRAALRLSSNRAAVALGERVGVGAVAQTARRMGITTDIPEFPSTLLGAASVIPLELVSAYTAFAGRGVRAAPRLIRRVEDARGRVIYDAPVRREAVLSPEVAFLTTDMMQDVVDHGTGWRVRRSLPASIPVAGKTGTTNDATDTWFVGVTPDLAAGVWIGFDQPRRIFRGAEGGNLAAPVWGRAVAAYYEGRPAPAPWQPPMSLVSVVIDPASARVATAACPPEQVRAEWFIAGTEPREYCELHPEPGLGGWFRRRLQDLFGSGDTIQ